MRTFVFWAAVPAGPAALAMSALLIPASALVPLVPGRAWEPRPAGGRRW